MFNERDALKLRLEQLAVTEEKAMKEFREERREIMNRLRELDALGRSEADSRKIAGTALASDRNEREALHFNGEGAKGAGLEKQEKANKGYHKKTILLRDAAINILKRHNTAIPLIQLKKELENATGIEIKNISLFMTNLAKKEKVLKKATHGQYMYVRD
ncbi:hypothetical protein [Peribacillus kribbensis]|uniref:Rok-like winged helix domain-containing protein n=1 Tax=Peribacillus kribbensis TaxID=356658 RepID=UPI000413DECF|nr:hypothetical protein [Peribacillus kribbensis]